MAKLVAIESPPVNVYEANDQHGREADHPGGGAKAMLTHGILTVSLPIGTEAVASRTRIPVSEPASHQGQPH